MDSRECGGDERGLPAFLALLRRANVRVWKGARGGRALPLGDLLIVLRRVGGRGGREEEHRGAGACAGGLPDDECVVPVLVERKRIDDAVASVEDGRWNRQLRRLLALAETARAVRRPVLLVQGSGAHSHWRDRLACAGEGQEATERRLGRAHAFGFSLPRVQGLVGCVRWLQRAVLFLAARLARLEPGDDAGVELVARRFDVDSTSDRPTARLRPEEGGLRCPVSASREFEGPLCTLVEFESICRSCK